MLKKIIVPARLKNYPHFALRGSLRTTGQASVQVHLYIKLLETTGVN